MTDTHLYHLMVAGVGITIQTPQPLTVTDGFLPFLTDAPRPDYLVEYRENPDLPQPEGTPLYRSESYEVYPDGAGGFVRWYFDGRDDFVRFVRVTEERSAGRVLAEYLPWKQEFVSIIGNCFAFSGWESLLIRKNRLCFHAACVDTELGGILFSGPSGIGKSTQADLWQRYRNARLINGDRPILSREQNRWLAWGSPYAGSSRCHVNDCCPVSAVVMLRQAPACRLRRLELTEGFRRIYAGLTMYSWNREFVSTAVDLAVALASEIPVFEFECTPERRAVDFLERELREVIAHE